MRGVILAAGDGGRFRPYTYRTPKVLIQLRERPLISYPMAAMAKAGISEVGVVVGYQAGRIVEELTEWAPDGMRLEFIYNHEFDGGNAVSVRAAGSSPVTALSCSPWATMSSSRASLRASCALPRTPWFWASTRQHRWRAS